MTNYYEVKTPPADHPVTLSQVKAWIIMDDDITEHDKLLQALIIAATSLGQKYTNRIFITTVFEGFFDCLQVTKYEKSPFITIKRAPVTEITSMEIYTKDAWEEFTDFQTKITNGFTRILFPSGVILSDYSIPYSIKVTFPAGYGDKEAVPDEIKSGIKQHIAFLYSNKGDVESESKKGMPVEVKAMYSQYRILDTF
jgi:uncharacterized phiE125 gp8 family phage protein